MVKQCQCDSKVKMNEEEMEALRKQLMTGYIEMAMINKQMANECFEVENEAMNITNKFLD